MKKEHMLEVDKSLNDVHTFLACLSNLATGTKWKQENCDQAEDLEQKLNDARNKLWQCYKEKDGA